MNILTSVKSALGLGPAKATPINLARQARSGMTAPVVTELPLFQQLQRIGGSLTPQQVSAIMRQADNGYMWQLVDLANEARQKDGHLQSVLQTRETALTGLAWQVSAPTPVGKNAKLRDRKAAEFCEEHLRQLQSLPGLISHVTGANYYGYAVAEILWKKDGSAIVPHDFDLMSPRRFIFEIATGKLRWCDINAGMPYPGIDLKAQFPGQFVQYQPRVNGDVPVREGLVRVLMWAALFRNWTLRDWLQLAELAWKPWRTGSYEKQAAQEDIDNLAAILEGMSGSGVAVYPNTTNVHVEWPKNSQTGNSAHGELYTTMGSEMSKAVLGQTLTTEQGKVGSQALGKVHDNVRRDILHADARAVGSLIMRDILTPMVRMNFGSDVQVPFFRFVTEDAADLGQFSTMVLNLSKAGLKMPASYIRQVAGIPEPKDDEEVIGGPPPPAPEEPNGNEEPANEGDGSGEQPDEEKPAPEPDEGDEAVDT